MSRRTVVILSPYLSDYRRGDIVTINQLGMTDDNLDQFIGHGHAAEVFLDDAVAAEVVPVTVEVVDVAADAPPARNASRTAWVEYAEPLGVETEGLSRDEIADLFTD